mmetsp:Transcript_3824/g.8291  ORF Transcript_3824/g.8291 Transcript_3824/m.8291 type:complete len:208 (+) Transcript_3824:2787-3410(+)
MTLLTLVEVGGGVARVLHRAFLVPMRGEVYVQRGCELGRMTQGVVLVLDMAGQLHQRDHYLLHECGQHLTVVADGVCAQLAEHALHALRRRQRELDLRVAGLHTDHARYILQRAVGGKDLLLHLRPLPLQRVGAGCFDAALQHRHAVLPAAQLEQRQSTRPPLYYLPHQVLYGQLCRLPAFAAQLGGQVLVIVTVAVHGLHHANIVC